MSDLKTYLDRRVAASHPGTTPDFEAITSRARARRVRRRARFGAGAAAGLAVLAFGAGPLLAGSDDPVRDGDPNPTAAEREGEVGTSGMSSCVENYEPEAIASRGFAFDATIASVDPSSGDADSPESFGLWRVTFTVEEWFKGGDAESVTTSMFAPVPASDESPPSYDVGTRLLVSGEYDSVGESRERAIVWGCGFTRYHDEATAAAWRAAVSD